MPDRFTETKIVFYLKSSTGLGLGLVPPCPPDRKKESQIKRLVFLCLGRRKEAKKGNTRKKYEYFRYLLTMPSIRKCNFNKIKDSVKPNAWSGYLN